MFQLPQFGHGEAGVLKLVAIYSAKGDTNLRLQSLHLNVPIPVNISFNPPPLFPPVQPLIKQKSVGTAAYYPIQRYRQITHNTDSKQQPTLYTVLVLVCDRE